MKYYIDTEFIEDFYTPLLGKARHFIDLISIGIVAEDGREYYAISNEFNRKDASDWVKENVLNRLIFPMPIDKFKYEFDSEFQQHVWYDNKITGFVSSYSNTYYTKITSFQELMVWHRKMSPKSNSQIAKEIIEFIHNEPIKTHKYLNTVVLSEESKDSIRRGHTTPEFYGYYADYDWVLFCSLFGRMIDLPKGFPMYCKDLKQMLDEKVDKKEWYYGRDIWSNTRDAGDDRLQEKDRPATFEEKLEKIKRHQDFPIQTNEHNALADAKWNMELHKFIQSL